MIADLVLSFVEMVSDGIYNFQMSFTPFYSFTQVI